jgi:aminoglycoside phosphotransferase family enzyme/predicted kinase
MITEDQSAVVDFLTTPSTHHGDSVERVETHAAIVFLAGARAWKLKRAVCYDYLDFSTVERRREMCEAEVRVNRRAAPQIYRGVVAITRQADGTLALGGSGTAVDWVVEMSRFDQEQLFDRLAARQALDGAVMARLASVVAAFHAQAEPCPDYGGADAMIRVVDGNEAGRGEHGASFLDRATCRRVSDESRALVARDRSRLEARRRSGHVRRCHGDLHLRNIVLLDGEPTLFDGVEFNDEFACIDVLYDLAFLLMDLQRRGLAGHANLVLNRYLAETGDRRAMALLPLFLSCRAAIRAKTSATAAAMQHDDQRGRELQQLSSRYLTMAERFLHPPAPMLMAVGGLSGTGKSTLARHLAPGLGAVPGAVILRTDELRKELFGARRSGPLGPEGYTASASTRVYELLASRAAELLAAGHCVIADGVFHRSADRARIEHVARAVGVPFLGFWLQAPASVLLARVASRRGDVSDAGPDVVRKQLAEPTGAVTWRALDASGAENAVAREAGHLAAVEALRRPPPPMNTSPRTPI